MKCLFPVENSHFGRPKQISAVFKSEKKIRSSPLVITFPTSISNFPPSFLKFSFFSSPYSPLFPFFLASFFPIRQQKFPGQKSLGGTLPPLTHRLLRHCKTTVCNIVHSNYRHRPDLRKFQILNSCKENIKRREKSG